MALQDTTKRGKGGITLFSSHLQSGTRELGLGGPLQIGEASGSEERDRTPEITFPPSPAAQRGP